MAQGLGLSAMGLGAKVLENRSLKHVVTYTEGINCTRLVWSLYIVTYSGGINWGNNPCVQNWLPIYRASMFNTFRNL